MTSLLGVALKEKIAKGFKGKLTLGILRRDTGAAVNNLGDATTVTTADYTFEGIRESFSARYKAQSGIPDTDVSILILLGSLKPSTTPKEDDTIYLKAPWNHWHQVRRILEIDPAQASCKVQAYEIAAP